VPVLTGFVLFYLQQAQQAPAGWPLRRPVCLAPFLVRLQTVTWLERGSPLLAQEVSFSSVF
jgi:hypothetical protein